MVTLTAKRPPNWALKLLDTVDSTLGPSWELFQTLDGRGRGLRATRDLPVHTQIFLESPLVIALTVSAPNVCVICYKLPTQNDSDDHHHSLCRWKCGLTVCNAPEEGGPSKCATEHQTECTLIRSWTPQSTDPGPSTELLLAILPAIRALALNKVETQLLHAMQANDYNAGSNSRRCIVDAAAEMFSNLPAVTVQRLKRIVAVLDTNAFETVVPLQKANEDVGKDNSSSETISLKGLFALGGQLNHECTPNTRHGADSHGNMAVYAARPIRCGEEITTTYTSLVWNRLTRRTHLWLTKRFLCVCGRCSSIEGTPEAKCDADLAALRCRKCGEGRLIPSTMADDLGGQCEECGFVMDHERVAQTQQIVAGILSRIADAEQLAEALESHPIVRRLVWPSNSLLMESKLRVIWKTESPLKPKFCEHILDILQRLNAGECTLKGLLLYELWKCNKFAENVNGGFFDDARRILNGNSIAPECMRY